MNDIFSFSRFAKLIKIHTQTHLLPIGIGAAIILAFLTACNILVTKVPESYPGKFLGLTVIFFIVAGLIPLITTIFASHSFRDYNRRSTATRMMMLPCSKLEQYTFLYITYVLLIPLLFACTALFIENLFLSSLTTEAIQELSGTPEFDALVASLNGPISIDDIQSGKMMTPFAYFSIWIWLAAYQSLYFLGSTIFKTVPFILTNVACIGIFIIFVILSVTVEPIADALQEMFDIFSPESHAPSFAAPLCFLILMTAASWLKFWKSKLI